MGKCYLEPSCTFNIRYGNCYTLYFMFLNLITWKNVKWLVHQKSSSCPIDSIFSVWVLPQESLRANQAVVSAFSWDSNKHTRGIHFIQHTAPGYWLKWWHMPRIPAFQKLRQEDLKCKASVGLRSEILSEKAKYSKTEPERKEVAYRDRTKPNTMTLHVYSSKNFEPADFPLSHFQRLETLEKINFPPTHPIIGKFLDGLLKVSRAQFFIIPVL